MVATQTNKRAEAMKATGDMARTALENIMKDAVAEAMREVEDERSSTSNRRRIPAAILLLGIGAIIGFAVASRREKDLFDTDTGMDRQAETQTTSETSGSMEVGGAGASESETDEEQADATTSD